jgi:hypothetical protein
LPGGVSGNDAGVDELVPNHIMFVKCSTMARRHGSTKNNCSGQAARVQSRDEQVLGTYAF